MTVFCWDSVPKECTSVSYHNKTVSLHSYVSAQGNVLFIHVPFKMNFLIFFFSITDTHLPSSLTMLSLIHIINITFIPEFLWEYSQVSASMCSTSEQDFKSLREKWQSRICGSGKLGAYREALGLQPQQKRT